jgi:hypothetical protein
MKRMAVGVAPQGVDIDDGKCSKLRFCIEYGICVPTSAAESAREDEFYFFAAAGT